MNRAVPDFVDPTPETPQPSAQPPVPPMSPWPRRIVGAVVIVAILAIAAAVIMPRQRQQVAPTSIQPSKAPAAAPNAQAAAPMPPPEPTPNALNPQPQGATPVPNQVTPNPTPTPSPSPTPNPNAPQQPARGLRPMMTPQQAQAIADQIDATERGQTAEGLRYMARYLRDPKFQDPDFWPIMQAALGTQGLAMVGGGATMGTAQVMALITEAKSGNEAADNLERYSYNLPSALPQAVKQQIAGALASATSPDEAFSGVQKALSGSGVQLSAVTNNYLAQAIQQAAQVASGGVPAPQ